MTFVTSISGGACTGSAPYRLGDLLFFEKQDAEFVRLGVVCVCSRTYPEQGLAALQEGPGEQGFVEEVKCFLQEQTLVYHYYYDTLAHGIGNTSPA